MSVTLGGRGGVWALGLLVAGLGAAGHLRGAFTRAFAPPRPPSSGSELE